MHISWHYKLSQMAYLIHPHFAVVEFKAWGLKAGKDVTAGRDPPLSILLHIKTFSNKVLYGEWPIKWSAAFFLVVKDVVNVCQFYQNTSKAATYSLKTKLQDGHTG